MTLLNPATDNRCSAQASPPVPTDASVFVETTPNMKVYVASFGGWSTKDKVLGAASDLQAKLASDGLSVDQHYLYSAVYDSPMRLMFRHNEVSTNRTATARQWVASETTTTYLVGRSLWCVAASRCC